MATPGNTSKLTVSLHYTSVMCRATHQISPGTNRTGELTGTAGRSLYFSHRFEVEFARAALFFEARQEAVEQAGRFIVRNRTR
jgi:hypothetical protein